MNIRVYYHKSDLDGRSSAAIIKYRFINSVKELVGLSLIGYEYGDDIKFDDVDQYDAVYVVDISFKLEIMIDLYKRVNHFIWIDHHDSAIKEYEKQTIEFDGLLDKTHTKSACALTWEYFYGSKPMPEGIRCISTFDTWQHVGTPEEDLVLSYYEAANMYLPTVSSHGWQDVLNGNKYVFDKYVEQGSILIEYKRKTEEVIADSYAFEVEINGVKGIALNTPTIGSPQFKNVYNPTKHKFMLRFARKPGLWKFSMYTTHTDFDCSEFCKMFGGGGHKAASGFEIRSNELPFKLI